MLRLVFVYQTLLDSATRATALEHAAPITPVVLKDWVEKKVGRYHTIEPSPGNGKSVKGAVLEVTRADLEKLDKWEKNYIREQVVLPGGKKAWAYVLDYSNEPMKPE